MNEEDKYSLEYAIGNSIQESKDKIAKLKKQVDNLNRENKKLRNQLEEKNKCLLEIAKEEIKFINYLKSKGMNFDNESWLSELEEFLERGKNANTTN